MSEKCIPCCDFCKNSDQCEHDEDGVVIDEYVMCHLVGKKVWIGGSCEKYVCRVCSHQ